MTKYAYIAQQAEHFLGKEEVTGSTPVISSKKDIRSGYLFPLLIYIIKFDIFSI